MKHVFLLCLSVLFFACSFCASGQSVINRLIDSVNSTRKQLPIEKLYLQTDKPDYLQGDTIWFKAYLLDADYLTPSPRSGLLYVELDDNVNRCVKRIMVPLASGLSWGNIALDTEGFPEGNYTLRAYTNWMRNFGEDYIFKKSIYIASASEQSRLVAADFKQTKAAGKDNIHANILISNLDEQPVRLKDMQLKVMDGKHTLFKSTASTGVDGKMDVNFDLPENTGTKNLFIIAQDVTKGTVDGASLTIPVILNRPENTDLQFMPEGGALVAGIPAKVGFKAIGEDGKGTDLSGTIYDSRQQQVAIFKSLYKGIGSFDLMPQAGENYVAKLTLPNGGTKSYPLPSVSASGTGLRVIHKTSDTLQVIISATADLLVPSATYYLVGQSRGVVCYGAQLILKNKQTTILVPENLFPTGIARFTLLNSANLPLNERICYIDHQDNLQLSVVSDKNIYAPHDSIALKLQVTDKGQPVRGSFSLAVTDDNQVKTDSTDSNIENNLLFTADLKGTVEEPGHYFENDSPESTKELDNLLLTQGWIGYNWNQILAQKVAPIYEAEPEFVIKGKVTNAFNKPVAGTQVILLSKKPSMLIDTISDKQGGFAFKGIVPVDTALFMVQAKNKRGKSFNVGVTMNAFKPPLFTSAGHRVIPWYVNSDTALMRSLSNNAIRRQAELTLMGPHILKGVTIKAKKAIKGSKNLNGAGGADEILDEKDMEKAGKMTLRQILQQKLITGFSEVSRYTAHYYTMHGMPLFLIIDGVNVDFFLGNNNPSFNEERYQYISTFLDNITAEDIIGIEGMFNPSKYTSYDIEFYPDIVAHVGPPAFAYLEITTRSGNGAFMKTTPGTYLYKPLPITLPKQFYRPKYTLKNSKPLIPDLRATIHWEPNIVTDTTGKATVSFYSADKPAGYSILIEGTDMNGKVGCARKKISVH